MNIPELASCRTVEELATAIDSMKGRLNEIQAQFGVQPLDDESRAEWVAIEEAIDQFGAAKTEFEGRLATITKNAKTEGAREDPRRAGPTIISRSRIPENLYDLTAYRNAVNGAPNAMLDLMRDGAMKAAEQWVYPHPKATPKGTVEHIQAMLSIPRPTKAIENGFDSGKFAEYLLAAGSPVYMSAWAKAIAGLKDTWTDAERAAIATVGTTTTGGYMVPVQLDPTIILTSDGAVNPLRQIATVRQINVGNTLQLISSAGVSASYGTERAARTPTAPTLARPEVKAEEASVVIDFSFAAGEDIPNLTGQLAPLIQDAKDMLEADKFVNGTGTNEPEGVLYGIASTYNVGTTGDGFDIEDISEMTTRLGDRWEPRASFLAHRRVFTKAEALDRAANGSAISYRPLIAGAPRELLGYPRYNASEMESDFATSGHRIMVFGDFGQYVIADKIGLSVELVPHMVDGDGKLVGRGLLARFRNGGIVAVDSAFRVLTVGVVTSGV